MYKEIETEKLKALMNGDEFDANVAMKLVRGGADPNVQSNKGYSLLHIVTEDNTGSHDKYKDYVTKLIKDFHAKVDIEDDQGFTPLQRLISRKFYAWVAMVLVRLGANPNRKSDKGDSLLLQISSRRALIALFENEHEYVRELVKDFKAEIDIKDTQGFTPLQHLISLYTSQAKNAIRLVRLGANPNNKSDKGNSLLHILATKNTHQYLSIEMSIAEFKKDTVALIREFKAEIDIEDAEGFTPLQLCVSSSNFPAWKAILLMRLGADFNRKLKDGTSSCFNRSLERLLESADVISQRNMLLKDLFFIALTADSTQQKLINSKINELIQKEELPKKETALLSKTTKISESKYFKLDRDILLVYIIASLSKDKEKLKELAFWENSKQFADLLKEEIVETSKASGNHQAKRVEFLKDLLNDMQEFDYFNACLKEFEIHFGEINILPQANSAVVDTSFTEAKQEASQELEEEFSFIKKPTVSFWGGVTTSTDDQVPVVSITSQPPKSNMGASFLANFAPGFSKSAKPQSKESFQQPTFLQQLPGNLKALKSKLTPGFLSLPNKQDKELEEKETFSNTNTMQKSTSRN